MSVNKKTKTPIVNDITEEINEIPEKMDKENNDIHEEINDIPEEMDEEIIVGDRNNLTNEILTEKNQLSCAKCEKIFIYLSKFKSHRCKENSIKCSICHKHFKNNRSLSTHCNKFHLV